MQWRRGMRLRKRLRICWRIDDKYRLELRKKVLEKELQEINKELNNKN